MNMIVISGIYLLVFVVIGWLIFSLTAGAVLYRSFLTTVDGPRKSLGQGKTDGHQTLTAHTKDSRIIEPIKEAKERWLVSAKNADRIQLSITAVDGLRLQGEIWFAQALESLQNGSMIILVHGFSDSRAGMAYLAEMYHKQGYSVLSIDQRCHGESQGKRITMGKKESLDIGLWIDFVKHEYAISKVVLHGVSMGAVAVLCYAGLQDRNYGLLQLVIADSAYTSYFEVFRRLVFLVVKNYILSLSITYGASLVSWFFGGVSFTSVLPENVVKKSVVPVLFIHGQKDLLVPQSMAQSLYSSAASPVKDLLVVAEAPHIGAWAYDPDLYWQKIAAIIQRTSIRES